MNGINNVSALFKPELLIGANKKRALPTTFVVLYQVF
jgi:hypothetical protein